MGEYWLQAGQTRLLLYSAEAGGSPCAYQVARLFDDVTAIAAHVLDPVPEELQHYISEGWEQYLEKWEKIARKRVRARGLHRASFWIGQRCLDTGYLAPSANIIFWSDRDVVYIGWDNRGKELDGRPALEASVGR